jgi:hypothetical protein
MEVSVIDNKSSDWLPKTEEKVESKQIQALETVLLETWCRSRKMADLLYLTPVTSQLKHNQFKIF